MGLGKSYQDPRWVIFKRVMYPLLGFVVIVGLLLLLSSGSSEDGKSNNRWRLLDSSVPHLSWDPLGAGRVKVVSWEPRIFLYEGFLSDEECDVLIASGESNLKRSEVAASEGQSVSEARTSYGTFISSRDNAVLQAIEQRVAMWTQLPISHQEHFYLLRYRENEEYKPHWDYFDPELPGMDKFIGKSGNRKATVLMYLQAPEEGGETYFPKADIAVKPARGDAVLFHSMLEDGTLDKMSLHGSAPVKKGTKYAATKWVRLFPWQ